jgi:hypothetical protein
MREGVAYKIIGGLRFYERKEIKDSLAYLRLVMNPHDDVSFTRVVNVPARGVGKTVMDLLDNTDVSDDEAEMMPLLARACSRSRRRDRSGRDADRARQTPGAARAMVAPDDFEIWLSVGERGRQRSKRLLRSPDVGSHGLAPDERTEKPARSRTWAVSARASANRAIRTRRSEDSSIVLASRKRTRSRAGSARLADEHARCQSTSWPSGWKPSGWGFSALTRRVTTPNGRWSRRSGAFATSASLGRANG